MRVLVADDDKSSRKQIEQTLVKAGYQVETADDGLAALEIIRSGRCRLVVSDSNMPRMNGLELCRAVRADHCEGSVHLILLTGHTEPSAIDEGLSAGADDMISKPVHPQELLDRVRAGERNLAPSTLEPAIFALAKLIESRDPETGHHLERVQLYSRALAQQLAKTPKYRDTVDREFIRLIYQTSPLHDIGKVTIPDAVLRKPGRLNDAEFAIMRTHAQAGADTLTAALDRDPEAHFLTVARDIAATHHERWDGSGYPAKLRGEAIPLAGRIVAVADVYDALTSKRCYKAAYCHDVAKSIIVNDSGKHFDPDVVAAFLAVEQEFVAIHERFGDEVPSASLPDELAFVGE